MGLHSLALLQDPAFRMLSVMPELSFFYFKRAMAFFVDCSRELLCICLSCLLRLHSRSLLLCLREILQLSPKGPS